MLVGRTFEQTEPGPVIDVTPCSVVSAALLPVTSGLARTRTALFSHQRHARTHARTAALWTGAWRVFTLASLASLGLLGPWAILDSCSSGESQSMIVANPQELAT